MAKDSVALEDVIGKLRDLSGSGACHDGRREDHIQELFLLCHRFVGLLSDAGKKELNRRSNILTEEINHDGFDRVRRGALADLEQAFSCFGEDEEKWQSGFFWDEENRWLVQIVDTCSGRKGRAVTQRSRSFRQLPRKRWPSRRRRTSCTRCWGKDRFGRTKPSG